MEMQKEKGKKPKRCQYIIGFSSLLPSLVAGILYLAGQLNYINFTIIFSINLIISIALFIYLYYYVIKPVNVIRGIIGDVISKNLHNEVSYENPGEFPELFEELEKLRLWVNALLVEQGESDSITQEVIGNISHDLKTPLTAIKGYAEGIIDGIASTPERIEKYVRTIYTKASDMSLLVDELSFFNNINQHDVQYDFSVVNINDYFSECIGDLINDLEMKKIHLLYQTYLQREINVKIDVTKLKRVINNIIGNASKYIDHNQGLILVKLYEEKEAVIVSLEDNGVGIKESELPYIFDRFYRTDSSRNSNTGGTGLGLAIAKKIITDHGGEIWAESVLGKGTTLLIKLKEFRDSGEHEQIGG